MSSKLPSPAEIKQEFQFQACKLVKAHFILTLLGIPIFQFLDGKYNNNLEKNACLYISLRFKKRLYFSSEGKDEGFTELNAF